MFAPTDRRTLLEALRPPDGFHLDGAVVTTFTLDLMTLLTVPLALQLYDLEDEDGRPAIDPVALLEALRQTSGKLSVFCQAGRIDVPATQQRLFTFLEDAVVEVAAPKAGGVFHPKLWALRLVNEAGDVAYRVLCSSRNLTADRSWDAVLTLDGRLTDRTKAIAGNHPLADLVAELPNWSRRDIGSDARDRVARIASELRRVKFDAPGDLDEPQFFSFGFGKNWWPYGDDSRRRLIISPFLSDGALERLTETGDEHVLVSRSETLAACKLESLKRFAKVYTLSPLGDAEIAAEAEGGLVGLHAKVVIGDGGWDSSVWMGSANASDAAFNRNVELVVQLRGRKSKVGVDTVLQSLLPLLTPYDPALVAPPDEAVGSIATAQEAMRVQLTDCTMVARVVPLTADAVGLHLVAGVITLDARLTVNAWPVTVAQDTHQRPVQAGPGVVADFGELAVESLSPFIAFEIRGGPDVTALRFVRALTLEGAPSDRAQRILRSILANRDQVLRLLLLLLSGEQQALVGLTGTDSSEATGAQWLQGGSTVFESLLVALHESPERLDRVQTIVADLQANEEGSRLLPEGFLEIWEPIWQARQGLKA